MYGLAREVRKRLAPLADEKFRAGVFNYFKETINPIGIRTPEAIKVAKQILKENKSASKKEIFGAVDELFAGCIFEEGRAGIAFLEIKEKELDGEDIPVLERFLEKYVDNWAWCDWLCTVIGGLFLRHPKLAGRTRKWNKSKNRWMRRASVVSFVLPARNGKLHGILLENAVNIIYDEDDLVRKGTGWALREAAKTDEKRIVSFLLKHRDAPRVTLRCATERMEKSVKEKILK